MSDYDESEETGEENRPRDRLTCPQCGSPLLQVETADICTNTLRCSYVQNYQ